MAQQISSNNYVQLFFDEELSLFKWVFSTETKEIDEEKLKELFKEIFATLKKYRPQFVIGDDRSNLAIITVEMQEWLAKLTVESLKFSGSKKFAVLRPKEMISDIATEQAVDDAKKFGDGIEIDMFAGEEEAIEWIQS